MTDDHEGEQPLYLNTEALLAVTGNPAAHGLALMLVFAIWEPERVPFVYDADAIFARLQAGGQKGIKRSDLDDYKEAAKRFFVILDDGRWAPSAEFFSVTDGNPGGRIV